MRGADSSWRPSRRTLLAAFAAALAFALSFPLSERFVSGWPLAFVWPALLALAAVTAPSWRAVVTAVFPAFYAAFLAHQWWMREITELGMPVLVGYLAAWMTVLALLIRALAGPRRRRGESDANACGGGRGQVPFALAVPSALVAVEFLRGDLVCSGYAWFFAAHPLVEWNLVAQVAALGGGWLLSGLAGFVAGAMVDLAIGPRIARVASGLSVALVAAAFAIAWMLGIPSRERAQDAGTVRFLLVQTNLPMSNKLGWAPEDQLDDFVDFARLTLDGLRKSGERVDAVVWPETMVPGFGLEPESLRTLVDRGLFPRDRFEEALRDLSSRAEAPLIVGSPAFIGLRVEGNRFAWDRQFNSAYLVDARGKQGRTDKIFLTPFGETMPIISNWDWLEQELLAIGANGMTFDLDAAPAPERFLLETGAGKVRVGVPICFEITAPWASRRIAFGDGGRAADVLVNISNDGWFGQSGAGRRQHLQVAQLRAIELRTPVVRAANTGMSASITAFGRVEGSLGANVPGTLVATVVPATARGPGAEPLAALVGDGVAWAALAFIGLAFAARWRGAGRNAG